MFAIRIRPLVCGALSLVVLTAGAQTRKPWSDDALGLSLTLPDESWQVRDATQGGPKTLQFSSAQAPGLRFQIMVTPASAAAGGLLWRETVLSVGNPNYQRIAYQDGTGASAARLAGQPAEMLEYRRAGVSRMLGQRRGDAYILVEIGSTLALWEQPATRRTLESILDSIEVTGPVRFAFAEADLSTPEEVRRRRAAAVSRPPKEIDLVSHTVRAEFDPAGHSLKVTDRLRLRALKPNVNSVVLVTSVVKMESVTGAAGVKWTAEPLGVQDLAKLTLTWDRPLAEGEQQDVTIQLSSPDFVLMANIQQFAEIGAFGQVRPASSWSSHVRWYPIDGANDAAVDITLVVPEEYTAVTGGRLIGVETRAGKREFHYASDIRKPRILPFGFAVARYVSRRGESAGGLPIEVYGYPGEERLVEQRLQLAIESANLFERMMGKLPFEAVRFAHVTPVSREMLVSLPGLILLSNAYYADISTVDISSGNPNGRATQNVLGLADELGHQWNAYSIQLPNELAEGISTFTDALVVEKRHGPAAYRNYMRVCANTYLDGVITAKDVAPADPAVYSAAYRVIAFCKNAVVLDMLRSELGDDRFFAGWRRVFEEFDGGRDGYDVVRDVFSRTTGTDMRWFFDQWFFQSGFPEVKTTFVVNGDTIAITLRQTQKQPAFRLQSEIAVRGASGELSREKVVLTGRETQVTVRAGAVVRDVVFDPDYKLLVRRVP